MDNSTEELLLQKLEELVFDEDKIVTIPVICEKCDISLKDGRTVFQKFISDQQINPRKISATYLISGKLRAGNHAMQIVDSSILQETKEKYACISDQVVYSVQKHNDIDFNMIAIAEKSECLRSVPLKGSVCSENCVERQVQINKLPPPPLQKNFEKHKANSIFKKMEPKNTIMNEISSNQPTSSGTGPKLQNKSGGLTSFLTNNSENKKISEANGTEDSLDEIVPKKIKIEKENSDTKTSETNKIKNGDGNAGEDGGHVSKSSSSKETSNNKRKAKSKIKNSNLSKSEDTKKRKRIVMESDSEDDLFGNAEDVAREIGESDEEKPSSTQPKIDLPPIPRNKRRKAVEKTYEDEDGYIVTRTEYVLVSASEDEEVIEKPEKKNDDLKTTNVKPEQKEEKKTSQAVSKGKKGKAVAPNQPTLMNFFKKK